MAGRFFTIIVAIAVAATVWAGTTLKAQQGDTLTQYNWLKFDFETPSALRGKLQVLMPKQPDVGIVQVDLNSDEILEVITKTYANCGVGNDCYTIWKYTPNGELVRVDELLGSGIALGVYTTNGWVDLYLASMRGVVTQMVWSDQQKAYEAHTGVRQSSGRGR